MRIIAGAARGRRLEAPPGRGTRPTSDRAREAAFSALTSMRGDWPGARVLDLFAGSGALGLEALSRGAGFAMFVDSDVRAAAVIRRNALSLHLDGDACVVRADRVERVLATPSDDPYDVVFADPPYSLSATVVNAVLSSLLAQEWLREDAVVVVERASRGPALLWPEGLTQLRERRYGEGTLWYGRRASGPASSGHS